MNTWVLVEKGIITTVVIADTCREYGNWMAYPYPCDLCGASNIAGRAIDEFDENGNFIALPEAEEIQPESELSEDPVIEEIETEPELKEVNEESVIENLSE
jgi:hypothetical protein